jgi:hypothetical protein
MKRWQALEIFFYMLRGVRRVEFKMYWVSKNLEGLVWVPKNRA